MTTDLFAGNIIILYFIFVISVITIDKFNEKQRIAIIYMCSYGILWDKHVSKRLLLGLLIVMIFLMLEYFTQDEKKLAILKKFHYKIVDFAYMSTFQYKLWAILLAISIRTNLIKGFCPNYPWVFDILSFVIFFIALHWMFNISEEYHTFTEMYNRIWEYPYYKLVQEEGLDQGISEEFKKRMDIIVDFEDRLYWARKKTYTIASLEYLRAWYKDKHALRGRRARESVSFIGVLKAFIIFPIRIIKFFFSIIRKAFRLFHYIAMFFRRGHSTLPMQMIRILGYKHGLVFGTSTTKFKYYKIFKRKIYELLYARMFFEGFKQYISVELCSGIKYYREYIVYLYPHIVQTTVKKAYVPAAKLFAKSNGTIQKMSEWNIDQVINMSLGFCGRPLDDKRILAFADKIRPYGYSQLDRLEREVKETGMKNLQNAKKRKKHNR